MNPMSHNAPPGVSGDAAWVCVQTPLSREELAHICFDVERMLRINPALVFEEWQQQDTQLRFRGRNQLSDQPLEWQARMLRQSDQVRIEYAAGLKASTEFRIEPSEQGARLWVIEDYNRLDEQERAARKAEADNSLLAWGNALFGYFQAWRRWRWFPPWRWYMRRVWQPMKPAARRISNMIFWISVAEFVAFLMVFTIFWLELDRFFQL